MINETRTEATNDTKKWTPNQAIDADSHNKSTSNQLNRRQINPGSM